MHFPHFIQLSELLQVIVLFLLFSPQNFYRQFKEMASVLETV